MRLKTAYRQIVALALVLSGCGDNPICPSDDGDCHCPAPERDARGPRIPQYAHTGQRMSPDGTKLLYMPGSSVGVVDLRSGQVQIIDVASKLPDNVDLWGCGYALWCPYDNNRILVHCTTFTDTAGDGNKTVYGQNSYIISLNGGEFQRVTPHKYGPAGSENGYGIVAWLAGSSAATDSLHMGGAVGIYIPQRDTFIPARYNGSRYYSRDGKSYIGIEYFPGGQPEYALTLNGQPLPIPDMGNIEDINWSPDGRKIVLSVFPEQNGYRRAAIVDLERYQRERPAVVPVQTIDFQKQFCTYSLWGLHAEFTSDSTLAVSMHKDGDKASVLWEITLDGRKVRQLTSVP